MTPSKKSRPAARRGTTRRQWLLGMGGLLGAAAGVVAYSRWVEPTWVEVAQVDLPVPGLPAAWDGARVALISDLHCGPWVPTDYLRACMDRVRALRPDLVAATGDFVTIGGAGFAETATGLLDGLRPPLGTFACLGNHDYGIFTPTRGARPGLVAGALLDSDVRLLRNEAVRLTLQGQDLWLAGTDDYWAGNCRPEQAVRDIPAGAAALTLCHNPTATPSLEKAGCRTILAGHTHGGQVHLPLLGPPILPQGTRPFYRGLYTIGRATLYVNRGLGWIRQVRLACRPEITVLTLCRG